MYINHILTIASLAFAGFTLAAPYDASTTVAIGKRQAEQDSNGEDQADPPSEKQLDQLKQTDQDLQTDNPSDPTTQKPDTRARQAVETYSVGIKRLGKSNGSEDDEIDEELEQMLQENQAAWNNMPTLPPDLFEAVDWQARLEVFAFARTHVPVADRHDIATVAVSLMQFAKPFLSRGRIQIIVDNTINQVKMMSRNGADINALLEDKLNDLDVDMLERQMGEMVLFRQEHEGDPVLSVEKASLGLPTPLDMLTTGQARTLAIAKARAGLFDIDQLVEYIMQQDPYLSNDEATSVVKDSLYDFSTPTVNFQPLVQGPSVFQRAGNWFKGLFGNRSGES